MRRRPKQPKPVINSLDDALHWLKTCSVGCDELIEFLEQAKRDGLELLPSTASLEMEETAERYALSTMRGEFTWGDVWERMVTTHKFWRDQYASQDQAHAVSTR